MNASILGLKRWQVRFNASRSISANAASIATLNDATFGYLDLLVTLSTTLHICKPKGFKSGLLGG